MNKTFWITVLILVLPIACQAQEDVVYDRPTIAEIAKQDWFINNLYDRQPSLCYMEVNKSGWSVCEIKNLKELKKYINRRGTQIVIPIYPTVYVPTLADKLYYDTIIKSKIKPKDKVLVIGAGSGSDAWVAWLKSQSLIYVIEINPMAIANTYATAQLAGFSVKQILGDIRNLKLPKDFSNFDFVLWNMPFLQKGDMLKHKYHDDDNGSVLKGFLSLLPSLLKKNGQAIIMNSKYASRFLNSESFKAIENENDGRVYIFLNHKN